MSKSEVPHGAVKCNAYARSTGETCKQFALANGKCHYHGGRTPIKHGLYTNEAIALRKQVTAFLRQSDKTMKEMFD